MTTPPTGRRDGRHRARQTGGRPGARPQLGTQIKAGQGPEIQTIRTWLQSWGAPEPTAGTSATSGQRMMKDADMNAVKAAGGAGFDQQWVTLITAQQERATAMAKQALTTQNLQVKALVEAVVKAQNEETATMKDLVTTDPSRDSRRDRRGRDAVRR
nr:DUF305 domain-containing protein [Intrasporangium chromatireducens]